MLPNPREYPKYTLQCPLESTTRKPHMQINKGSHKKGYMMCEHGKDASLKGGRVEIPKPYKPSFMWEPWWAHL